MNNNFKQINFKIALSDFFNILHLHIKEKEIFISQTSPLV